MHRQALAGMLWSKQYYYFDLDRWLEEHDAHPLMGSRQTQCPQYRVVPHAEQRHYFDARQVGVSLVCRMGSGFSHALRYRWWTSILPRINFCSCCGISMRIRMGRFRPTSGTSAT